MIINTIALACLDASAKILTKDLNPTLVVFLYKFSLLIIIMPWILSGGLKVFKTKRLTFHILRSSLSVFAAICFFNGLKYVNMGEAAVLENIQYLLVSVIGMIFFQEKCTKARAFAIIFGLLGACVVVNPNLLSLGSEQNLNKNPFNFGYLYIFGAMILWAMNTVTVKILGNTESNKTQMFYLLFFASIFGGISALTQWSAVEVLGYELKLIPSLIDFSTTNLESKHSKFLLMMAAFYFMHGTAYFNALKFELSLVIPFRYTKLIFSGIFSYAIFNELQEDPRSYIGYAFILMASLALLKEEIKKRQAKKNKELQAQPA
jgi:S-adenosylmethionine uptake transporter